MKNEKGAITLYVTVVCLFILIMGIIAYVGTVNRQATQLAVLNKIEEKYNNEEIETDGVYNQYEGGDIVPIYTPEQFAKVGSGEEVYVEQTGKFYTFGTDKTYMFYGVPEDFNVVLGQAGMVSVYEGEDNELNKYFSYNENESDLSTSVVYTDNCHNNKVVTNTKDLEEGTHSIKCTVTKQSAKTVSGIKIITIKDNGLADQNTTIKPSASSNIQIVIPKGFAPAILEGSDSTTSLPGESGKVASLMPKEQWNSITIEQINKGIVIVNAPITYDGGKSEGKIPDFQEFVWVPIPTSEDFARVAWVEGVRETTHELSEVQFTSGTFWEFNTTTEYTNMVESVNTNKGFYISRYEASMTEGRVESKRGVKPDEYMMSATAQRYAASADVPNAHLIYGIEWDSILSWFINSKAVIRSAKEGINKEMTLEDVQRDSSSWGNYEMGYERENGDIYWKAGSAVTGYSEYWKANNIYDLAGNLEEWTSEHYGGGNFVLRGGHFYYSGEDEPVVYRYSKYWHNDNEAPIGFRFSFYI